MAAKDLVIGTKGEEKDTSFDFSVIKVVFMVKKFIIGTIWHNGTKASHQLRISFSNTDLADILKVHGR